jgi:hypothetical protein
MIWHTHGFGSNAGELFVEGCKVGAPLAILLHLALAIENGSVDAHQTILYNRFLLLRQVSQALDFYLNNLLRHGMDVAFHSRLDFTQRLQQPFVGLLFLHPILPKTALLYRYWREIDGERGLAMSWRIP